MMLKVWGDYHVLHLFQIVFSNLYTCSTLRAMLAVGYFPLDGPNLQDHHWDITYFFGRSLFDIRSRDKKPSADCNVCFYQTYPSQSQQPVSTWNKILVGLGWMIFLVSRALDGQPYTRKRRLEWLEVIYIVNHPLKKKSAWVTLPETQHSPWKLRVGRLYTFLLGFRPIFKGFCCSFYREWTFFHFWASNPKKWHERKKSALSQLSNAFFFRVLGYFPQLPTLPNQWRKQIRRKKRHPNEPVPQGAERCAGFFDVIDPLKDLVAVEKLNAPQVFGVFFLGVALSWMQSCVFDNSGWRNTLTQWKTTYMYIWNIEWKNYMII